jgi:hypothetical protein
VTWPANIIDEVFKMLLGGISSTSTQKHVSSKQNLHKDMGNQTKKYVMHEIKCCLCQWEPIACEVQNQPLNSVVFQYSILMWDCAIPGIKSLAK